MQSSTADMIYSLWILLIQRSAARSYMTLNVSDEHSHWKYSLNT